MKKYLFVFTLIFITSSLAQDKYFELVRADFKAEQVKYITDAMDLNDDESNKFWPIYREFDFEKTKIGDQKYMLIKNYAQLYQNMDNEKANEIINKLFNLQEKDLKLKKGYYKKIGKALSPLVAARFIQVINEIDNFVSVQVYSQLPLIGNTIDDTD